MFSDKLKELEAMRSTVATLESHISAELANELRKLPSKYGFSDVPSFVRALREATRGRKKRGKGKGTATAGGKWKRAKITDETRAEVKKLVKAGKTGREISKAVGISLPTVQNIKKALGLVRKT